MKTKLRDMNQSTQLLALDFLDYSVDKGKMPLWNQVGSKDFLMCLITLIKTRDVPDVQNKILFLIEKWSKKFDPYKEILPIFKEVYSNLKSANLIFPKDCRSTYYKYLDNADAQYCNKYDPNPKVQQRQSNDINRDTSKKGSSGSYGEIYEKLGIKPSLFEKKYKKLVLKLSECTESLVLSNDMIDNSQLGRIDESLKDIMNVLRHANSQLIETISSDKLKDERLMELSLGITEDINRTIKRYESLKQSKNPEPLLSYFGEYNESQPKNKNVEKPQTNVFDLFPNQQIPQVETKVNQTSNVNDLFDIFSNPQPVSNQVPFNQTNNNMMPMDLFSNQMPQQSSGQNQMVNLFEQIHAHQQTNQANENKQNMLSEQLKMAYGNEGNMGIGMGMNMGMGMGMNMSNNQIFTQPKINNPNPNSMNIGMQGMMQNPNQMLNMPQPKQQTNNNIDNPPIDFGVFGLSNQFNQPISNYQPNQVKQNQPDQNLFNLNSENPNMKMNNMNFNQPIQPQSSLFNIGMNQTQQQQPLPNSNSIGYNLNSVNIPNQNQNYNLNIGFPSQNQNMPPNQNQLNPFDSLF